MAQLLRVEAKEQAQRVRDEYGTDLYQIVAAMGLTVMRRPMFGDISGAIMKKEDQDPEILINSMEPAVRQRFTLAHELGHYIERLEIAGDSDFSFEDHRSSSYDAHEFFADEFAGNLLMPEDEVRRAKRAGESVLSMARRFDVSPAAMQQRLKNIKRWEAADAARSR